MREASSYPVYKDERTTLEERFFALNWEAGVTWAVPYEKYAVCGEKVFPTTARRDFST
jgi:hypothetical protein